MGIKVRISGLEFGKLMGIHGSCSKYVSTKWPQGRFPFHLRSP